METTLKYFKGSIGFAIFAVIFGYWWAGFPGAYAILMLSLLETSLSIDNAVVNAKVLENMSDFWKKMFLTVGMIIAVFGMRIVFPLVIVGFVTGMDSFPSLWTAVSNLGAFLTGGAVQPFADNVLFMAINRPDEYSKTLMSSHIMIAGFGGAFLLMVALKFFIDHEKDHHWMPWIEAPLSKLGILQEKMVGWAPVKIDVLQAAITCAVLYGVCVALSPSDATKFVDAGMWGIIVYIAVDLLGNILEGGEEGGATATQAAAKSGFASFMYLEILDASFSFDGVIGAFAVTNNLVVIALGLGVGAFFVRSMTIMLVDKGTLSEFKYLEHGAFYAIISLAAIMFISTFHHLSELVSGTIGALFIGAALWSSIKWNRQQAAAMA